MNKKYYTKPKMEVKQFDSETIVTVSAQPLSLRKEGVNVGTTQILQW